MVPPIVAYRRRSIDHIILKQSIRKINEYSGIFSIKGVLIRKNR